MKKTCTICKEQKETKYLGNNFKCYHCRYMYRIYNTPHYGRDKVYFSRSHLNKYHQFNKKIPQSTYSGDYKTTYTKDYFTNKTYNQKRTKNYTKKFQFQHSQHLSNQQSQLSPLIPFPTTYDTKLKKYAEECKYPRVGSGIYKIESKLLDLLNLNGSNDQRNASERAIIRILDRIQKRRYKNAIEYYDKENTLKYYGSDSEREDWSWEKTLRRRKQNTTTYAVNLDKKSNFFGYVYVAFSGSGNRLLDPNKNPKTTTKLYEPKGKKRYKKFETYNAPYGQKILHSKDNSLKRMVLNCGELPALERLYYDDSHVKFENIYLFSYYPDTNQHKLAKDAKVGDDLIGLAVCPPCENCSKWVPKKMYNNERFFPAVSTVWQHYYDGNRNVYLHPHKKMVYYYTKQVSEDDNRKSTTHKSKLNTLIKKKNVSYDEIKNISANPKEVNVTKKVNAKSNRNVKGDGNCLFRAVALSIFNDEEMCYELRRLVVHYMWEHYNYFRDFGVNDDYIVNMSKDRYWGGEPEIVALSGLFGVNITVLDLQGNVYQRTTIQNATSTIRLCYYNYGNKKNENPSTYNHFDLI